MDYNGKWTPATVTSASNSAATPPPPAGARAAAPPPVAAAVAAAYHQGNGVAEDSDDEGGTDLSSSSHPGSSSADSGGGASSSSSGDLESMNEAELSAYVNDQVGGLLSFEEFKDALIRGIQVVKFNRRGAAAFRTLTLLGDHTLTWTTPKEVCDVACIRERAIAYSIGDPSHRSFCLSLCCLVLADRILVIRWINLHLYFQSACIPFTSSLFTFF